MKKLFLTLLLSSSAFASELTLYVVPSPGIDWTTPRTLLLSTLKSKLSFKPHFMGHVWVDLKCKDDHFLSGMTDENPGYVSELLFQGRGLGILFHSFPGRLEKKEDVEKELASYFQNGGINFVKFTLNENQCLRASKYLKEYQEKNVGRHYGLFHRPRHGEGAGCSAFATSVPDVLDILDQDMKEGWSESIRIPLDLAGPPLQDEPVSVFKLLTANEWAPHTENYFPLTFWSPDKMYDWIKEKISKPQSGYTVSKIQNVEGIVIDKSHFPTPEGPIWIQQTEMKSFEMIGPKRSPKKP